MSWWRTMARPDVAAVAVARLTPPLPVTSFNGIDWLLPLFFDCNWIWLITWRTVPNHAKYAHVQDMILDSIFKLQLTCELSTGICWKVTGPVVKYVIWGVANWTVLGVVAIRTFWTFGETAAKAKSQPHSKRSHTKELLLLVIFWFS